MATPSLHTSTSRRAGRSLWILVGVSVLAAGSLSAALAADAGPWSGLRVAVSGLILVCSVVLAARVMFAIERARRRGSDQQSRKR
jgi:hypothetical protein